MQLPELPTELPLGSWNGVYSKAQMEAYAKAAIIAERKLILRALAMTTYPVMGTAQSIAGGPFQRAVEEDIQKRDKGVA